MFDFTYKCRNPFLHVGELCVQTTPSALHILCAKGERLTTPDITDGSYHTSWNASNFRCWSVAISKSDRHWRCITKGFLVKFNKLLDFHISLLLLFSDFQCHFEVGATAFYVVGVERFGVAATEHFALAAFFAAVQASPLLKHVGAPLLACGVIGGVVF